MTKPPSTSRIEADQIISQYVTTGNIHKTTVINIIQAGLNDLTALVKTGEALTWRQTGEEAHHLSAGGREFSLTGDLTAALRKLAADTAIDNPALRRQAYAGWLVTRHASGPPQHVAARDKYIPLGVRLGRERPHINTGYTGWYPQPEGPPESRKLKDVSEALNEHPAFVLLGAPGSGKSTVLHRLEQEMARAYLTGQGKCLPLLLTLGGYHWEEDPLTFINRQWELNTGAPLIEMLRGGQVALLLDGLNEMDRLDSHQARRQRANNWQDFLQRHFSDVSLGNRAIVASRTNDYEQSLNLPRVEIDPLNDDQIQAFLQAYLGDDEADDAFAAIKRLDLLELAKVPYSLAVLAEQYDPAEGDLPPNQGRLFNQYINHLLAREDERTRKLYWVAARLALNELGYCMQERGERAVLPADDIETLIPSQVRVPNRRRPEETPPPVVFDVACQADLLRLDPTADRPDDYKFTHQLLQEQLAAADLYRRWQQGEDVVHLWRIDLRRDTMPPADVGEWDPLPPPPPTGWEQTTLQAAGLPDYADTFVRAALQESPILAGRCLSEGFASVSDETRKQVQSALLNTLSDPSLHRRARIQAGRVLAQVDDPRFTPQEIKGVKLVRPEWVHIPGGSAAIGQDDSEYEGERPRHQLEMSDFYLARYPVSNAEYACFIAVGGYHNSAYWTPAGWQWRQGELDSSGVVEDYVEQVRYFANNPAEIETWLREERISPDNAEGLRQLIRIPEDELRNLLAQQWGSGQPHEKPNYWDDPAYNASNQPVVGVTWYEAMAYAAWLNDIYDLRFTIYDQESDRTQVITFDPKRWRIRLPSEAEWEWAARGAGDRIYAWGDDFEADKCNTLEGRVLGTSPLGAYPTGATPEGVLDLTGNVWEWTHSLYRPYPYQADDGREDPQVEGRRTVRGGSWYFNRRDARVSVRNDNHPDFFFNENGFRLLLAPAL